MSTADDQSVGMDYLESFPRKFLRVYFPLGLIIFFLLFPFYWMAVATFAGRGDVRLREVQSVLDRESDH